MDIEDIKCRHIENSATAYEIIKQVVHSWSKSSTTTCLLNVINNQVDVSVAYGNIGILFSIPIELTHTTDTLLKEISSKLYTVIPMALHDKAIEAKNLDIETMKKKLDIATKLISGLAFSAQGMEYKNLIKDILGD